MEECKFGPNLTSNQKEMLTDLIKSFSHVFAQNPKAPKMAKGVLHYIKTQNEQVSFDKVRRIPNKNLKEINTQIDEM